MDTYGRLVNGKLYTAPSVIMHEGSTILNPTVSMLLEYGYKKIVYTNPHENSPGKYLRFIWREIDGEIVQVWSNEDLQCDGLVELYSKYIDTNDKLRGVDEEIELYVKAREKAIENETPTSEYYLQNNSKPMMKVDFQQFIYNKIKELFEGKKMCEIIDFEYNCKDWHNRLRQDLKIEEINESHSNFAKIMTISAEDNTLAEIDYNPFGFSYFWITKMANHERKLYYKSAFYNMVLINLVVILEQYILDVIRIVLQRQPNALKSKNGSVAYEKILKCSSYDDVIMLLINEKIELLGWNDITTKVKFLKDKGIDLSSISNDWYDEIVLLYEIRNALIHNNGIVNYGILNKLKETKYKSSFQLGDDISPNREKISALLKFTEVTVTKLYYLIKEKYFTV